MPVGPSPRDVLHVPRVYQTGTDSMPLQHVVERNPVDSGGLHSHRRNAATHQPSGHLLQILRKRWEDPHRILVPVRWHGDKNLSRADVDARRARLQNGTAIQRHPFSSPPPALAGDPLLPRSFFQLLNSVRHLRPGGCRFLKCWSNTVWKYFWSMPGTRRTYPDAKSISRSVNGC